MTIYGYARVSTLRQKKDGNSLEAQKRALMEHQVPEENIFVDNTTGSNFTRPEFSKLLALMEQGDTLIVTKLDRFARSTGSGSGIIKSLVERGIRIHILNMGTADNTPMGKLMVTILLAFAEYERDMIIERTTLGKAIARERGKRVDGRPKKFSVQRLDHAMSLIDHGNSYNEVAFLTGISRSTLLRERRERKAKEALLLQNAPSAKQPKG